MNHSIFTGRARTLIGAFSAAVALSALAGCQGHKIDARVNNVPITDNELVERALRTHLNQNVPNIEVGGYTLIMMIKEELIHQLAGIKHADITPEDVQSFAAFQERANPQYVNAINAGEISEEDFERDQRLFLENVGIGTEGAKADDKDIQAKYAEMTKAAPGQKPKLMFPELWTIRTLLLGDEATAESAVQMLNAHNPFPIVAQKLLGISPIQAQQTGRDNVIAAATLQQQSPALYAALEKLTPGQIIAKPVQVSIPNPQTQATQQGYVVAQMIKQEKAQIPTLQQARTYLSVVIITSTRPQWQQHANQALAAYTASSAHAIQINIERYKPLLATYIMPQAATYVGPGGESLTAPPPGEGAGTPPPGATAPPPGEGAAAPPPGAPAPAPGAGTAAPPSGGAGAQPTAPPPGGP